MNRRILFAGISAAAIVGLAGGAAIADVVTPPGSHSGNPEEVACVTFGSNLMYYDYNLAPCRAGTYSVVWNYIPVKPQPVPTVTKTVTVSPSPSVSASASASVTP